MTQVPAPHPIVADLLAGDRTAWARLDEEFRDQMYRAAYRVARNSDDALKARQSAIRDVITAGPQRLATVTRLGPYLAQVAANKAHNINKDRQRNEPTDPALLPGPDADPSVDPEALALEHLAEEAEIALLAEMPNQKAAFAYVERVRKRRRAKDVAKDLDVDPSYISQLCTHAGLYIAQRSPYIDLDIDALLPKERRPGTKDPT